MHKPLTTVPQTSARFGHEGTRKPANCRETGQKYRARSGGRKLVKSILHWLETGLPGYSILDHCLCLSDATIAW